MPRGCVIELQFADELDELFADELYDLLQQMEQAEAEGERRWFLCKPAMSDKGQGIRLFSSRAELEEIFEEMEEEESEDGIGEEEEEDDIETEGEQAEREEEEEAGVQTSQLRHFVIQVSRLAL